jgi:Fic family protein
MIGSRHQVCDIGKYRTSPEPMRVVSGYIGNENIHFEALPSTQVLAEMEGFIRWYNESAPNGERPLPALARAGLAHIYFLSIHPFEDGNGRIGRALSEKALAQSFEKPRLFALSRAIERNRPEYYSQLERSQRTLNIEAWSLYFARTVLDATTYSQRLVHFIVAKTRLLDQIRDRLNERQYKVLIRMFAEGVEGFRGGLSAEKYCKISGTISRTASRDLAALMDMGALIRTGSHKGTRYWLNLGEEFEGVMHEHLARQSK